MLMNADMVRQGVREWDIDEDTWVVAESRGGLVRWRLFSWAGDVRGSVEIPSYAAGVLIRGRKT